MLPDGIQDNVSFFAEQEEHGDLDVVSVLPVTCHLEQRGSVTAAPLVVICSENKHSSQGICQCGHAAAAAAAFPTDSKEFMLQENIYNLQIN